jgi:hypothetical protein
MDVRLRDRSSLDALIGEFEVETGIVLADIQ